MGPVLEDPQSFLEGQPALPPLPIAVTRLRGIADNGRVRAAEVVALFNADAGLTRRLLTIVNSVCYDLPAPIKDIKQGVAYLGLQEIKSAALTVGVMQSLEPDDAEESQRFWRHSFHTALTAKSIARGFSKVVDAEQILMPALLHDLGKLVYICCFPQSYAKLSTYQRGRACLFVDAEVDLGLPSHTLLGSRLCERWSLPEAVKRSCENHELDRLHRILDAENPDQELKVICVANLLSNLCTEELTDELKSMIQRNASQALGLDEHGFLLLMGELYELRSKVHQLVQDLS